MINYKSLVCILAARLIKNSEMSRSEAFYKAWHAVKKAVEPQAITAFFASQGKVETRVIDRNWTKYSAPKGGASKPGLFVFADLEKVVMGVYPTRSACLDNIQAA